MPYYLGTPVVEAVKHLRLTAHRYLTGRANLNDIEEAVAILRSVAPVKGEKGYRP